MNDLIMSRYELLGYFIEIVIAELLFLHVCERKRNFVLRFIISITAGMTVSALLGKLWEYDSTGAKFIILLIVICVSITVMSILFEGGMEFVISGSIAGVATQHIANKTVHIFDILFIKNNDGMRALTAIIMEVIVVALVYIAIFFVFARNYGAASNDIRSNIISIVVVLMCIGVNRLVADHANSNIYYEAATGIYAIICCVFSLTIQLYIYKWHKEKSDAIIIKNLLQASEKQYEQWKSMEEFISIRIHDLKHMLDRIERLSKKDNIMIPDLDSVRKTIDGFKPDVRTGNEVIDILLRNMVVLCMQQNIRFNVVSYTNLLENFDSMSLYFLFANAIDNAREAADKVGNKDKRVIDMSIKQFGNSIIIHIWNYFEGELLYMDNLPVSSRKNDGHGYGLKSIKMIVDTFEGVMSTKVEGECFHLNIILPYVKLPKNIV